MTVGVTLPGGRGQIVGASANAVYGEQLRQRVHELPHQEDLVMRTCQPSATWSVFTAATTQLFPIDAHPTIQPVQVRIYCDQASAGSTFVCALYTPEISGASAVFREVPGTRAIFNTSATGIKTQTLTGVRLLEHSQPLFAGFWPSDNVLGVHMGFMSYADVTRYTPAATVALASLIHKSDVSATYAAQYMPLISYYSSQGAKVF